MISPLAGWGRLGQLIPSHKATQLSALACSPRAESGDLRHSGANAWETGKAPVVLATLLSQMRGSGGNREKHQGRQERGLQPVLAGRGGQGEPVVGSTPPL